MSQIMVDCVGGPLDGTRAPLPEFAPGEAKSMTFVSDAAHEALFDLDNKKPIVLHTYRLEEPEDGAPYFRWSSGW